MEQFSYVDIFASKGIEYLFVIGFLVLFIIFWKVLDKQTVEKIKTVLGTLTDSILKIPQGILYGKNHTWVHMEKSGSVKVGINDLLQHITGEVTVSAMKEAGELIKKGELMTKIEQNGKTLEILAPISGRIEQTNESLMTNPEVLNLEPYGDGWMYNIKPDNWKKETKSFYFAEEASEWIKNELRRFKDFLAVSMKKHESDTYGIAYQDGGELIDHTLKDLPEDVWSDFQKEFLT
jgi:glycine cleavage system H protein